MGGFLENIGHLVARLWQGGKAFLWGCAAACTLVFVLLYVGSHFGLANVAADFSQYGLLVLVGAVVFTTLAIARTWEARPKKTLFFVSNEEQTVWGHARQKLEKY